MEEYIEGVVEGMRTLTLESDAPRKRTRNADKKTQGKQRNKVGGCKVGADSQEDEKTTVVEGGVRMGMRQRRKVKRRLQCTTNGKVEKKNGKLTGTSPMIMVEEKRNGKNVQGGSR